MHFSYPQKVLFKHCDPAGIVFYPRYFEMINDAVEAMFDGLFDWPFEKIHDDGAVPTAAFDVQFKRPCHHGDQLDLQITLTKIGGSSLSLTTRAMRGDQLCFEADQTLVNVNSTGRPIPWPAPVRTKITDLLEGA